MTAEQRIFLRRHWQAYGDLIPDQPLAVRRAVARIGYGYGISIADLSWWFGISWASASNDVFGERTRRAYLARWKASQSRVKRARNALRYAEGLERAAAERARARGLELAI